MRGVLSVLTGLALGVGGAGAIDSSPAPPTPTLSPTTLKVAFKSVPGLIYNRLGDSVLSVTGPAGTRSVKLSGTPYPEDEHYWAQLIPVQLSLPLTAGLHTVTLNAKLFVCDKQKGLCSVQTREQQLQVTAGRPNQVTLAAPLLNLDH